MHLEEPAAQGLVSPRPHREKAQASVSQWLEETNLARLSKNFIAVPNAKQGCKSYLPQIQTHLRRKIKIKLPRFPSTENISCSVAQLKCRDKSVDSEHQTLYYLCLIVFCEA